MSTVAYPQNVLPQRSSWLWLAPLQAAAVFTVVAIASGAQALRAWLLSAGVWLMALPLLVSLEAGLVAMMLFEPFRGVIRRAQYLLVDYSTTDPIHILTPIVTILAFALLLRSHRLNILRASPLAIWVSSLGFLYFVEIFNPLQGGFLVGASGAMFVLVPLLWFYFGQAAQTNFIHAALRLIVIVGLLTSLYGIYQLVFGYPSFEQYWIDNTEFYQSIAVGHITRALATFSSAEEWGRYAEIGAIIAFGFTIGKMRWRSRLAWATAGLLLVTFVCLTSQRAAVFGLAVGLAALVLLGARSFTNSIARLGLLLIPAVLILAFVHVPDEEQIWSNSEDQTVSTVLLHTERGVLKPAGEESFQERLTNWGYLLTDVIPHRPIGAGVGAGSLSESRFSDSYDLPPIDSSILRNAVSCGIPGMLLFVWILFRAVQFSWRGARRSLSANDHANVSRIVAAVIVSIVVNSVFGMTFTLYAVAPIAWLLVGWTSSQAIRRDYAHERETLII